MSRERQLAVVVPTYNEEKTIVGVLGALYGQQYNQEGVLHVVVDNASTDETRSRIESFHESHSDFPLVVLDEAEKGTGAASDTGFRYAAENGYPVIARTDADTQPSANWTGIILDNFETRPTLGLLGGRRLPLNNEWYRLRDSILWPLGTSLGDIVYRFSNAGASGKRIVSGCNMATRADAYVEVDGFPRTAIDEVDEDIVYARRIGEALGRQAIGFDPNMRVFTSMRRVRHLGYWGMLTYRLNQKGMDQQESIGAGADIR